MASLYEQVGHFQTLLSKGLRRHLRDAKRNVIFILVSASALDFGCLSVCFMKQLLGSTLFTMLRDDVTHWFQYIDLKNGLLKHYGSISAVAAKRVHLTGCQIIFPELHSITICFMGFHIYALLDFRQTVFRSLLRSIQALWNR
jgi:hypothetical protein